jgi:hypothetical protein
MNGNRTPKRGCRAINKDTCKFCHPEANTAPFVAVVPIEKFYTDLPAKVKPLKEMSFVHLAQTIVSENSRIMNTKKISHAIELATYLHRNDKRSNRGKFETTPYIEHPLRNTLRLMRYGCKKESILIATVLHDTVEDHAFEISSEYCNKPTKDENDARENSFVYIKDHYGPEVEFIVRNMSNPISEENISISDKHKNYAEHVIEAIQNPHVFVSKFSDYVDNAVGLYHNAPYMKPESVSKKAKKYSLLYNPFKEALQNFSAAELSISEEGKQEMLRHLEAGNKRLQNLIIH